MELSANSWVPQLYLRISYAWSRFFHGERSKPGFAYYVKDSSITHTNLCTFIRTIFLWGSLYLVVMAVPFIIYYYALIDFPISYFGATSVLRVFLTALFGLIVCAATAFGLFWLIVTILNSDAYQRMWDVTRNTYRDRRRMWIARAEHKQAVRASRTAKGPGLFKLLWTWLQDKHSNMCTIIKIEVK